MSRQFLIAAVLFASAFVAGCGDQEPEKAQGLPVAAKQAELPMSWQQYQERGTTRDQNGDTRGAIEDFTAALKDSPPNPALYFLRGSARLKVNDAEGAVADFKEGLVLDPGNEPLKVLLRVAQDKLGANPEGK